jgi:DNA-binding MarR family transcriptional regulator
MMDSIDPGPAGSPLAFALRRAQRAVTEDFAARFGGEAIRPAQLAVLDLLRRQPGVRQSAAGVAVGIKRTNFVPLLDALERRGLAERRRVPQDRRAVALFLTDQGEALLTRLHAAAAAHEARFTARLGGPDNRFALLSLLQRLADAGFDGPDGNMAG